MKQTFIIISIMLWVTIVAFPQTRHLVNEYMEVIPIKQGENALEIISQQSAKVYKQSACTNTVETGFTLEQFPYSSNFGSYHKDVLGEWFITPYTGTLDTLFWRTLDKVGSYDSTVIIRLFKSNIRPGVGPGNAPYPPPCQPWGYYVNINDSDMHITPFKDKATDTNWISTVTGETASFDPLGEELWGNGGVVVHTKSDQINFVALNTLGFKPIVTAGDAFFVTMEINSPNRHIETDISTDLSAVEYRSFPNYSQYYPSRNWKFYEHPGGGSNCSGFITDSLPYGWVARGGFRSDTSYSAAYNWWYSITTEANTEPTISDLIKVNYSSTLPITVCLSVDSCSRFTLDELIGEFLLLQRESGRYDTIQMSNMDSNSCVTLPSIQVGEAVCYNIYAYDSGGGVSIYPHNCHQYYGELTQNGYQATIGSSQWIEINNSTNRVSHWFLNDKFNHERSPADDGTSGPFDLGQTFNFFGNNVRYIWISINGDIAFSSTPDDTIHINNHNVHNNWTIPAWRSQIELPKNYLAASHTDLILDMDDQSEGDTAGAICATKIGTKFIIEWDSILVYNSNTTVTFQIILNLSDSSIIYQYKDVGDETIVKPLVGLSADSLHWFLMCDGGRPQGRTPANGLAFKFKPINPLGISNDITNLPQRFELFQNYPNPFNPITEFGFRIADYGITTLKIYDVLGREVTTIVNEKLQPGTYQRRWDANGFSSGVYYYRLIFTPFSNPGKIFMSTKKLIFMK